MLRDSRVRFLTLASAVFIGACGGDPGGDGAGRSKGAAATRPSARQAQVELSVEVPRSVTARSVTLAGTATPGARVVIKNLDVHVPELRGNRFRAKISVRVGANAIRVRATKSGHKAAERSLPLIRKRSASKLAKRGKAESASRVGRSRARVRTLSGRGDKALGTVRVETASVLVWSNDGGFFQVVASDSRRPLLTSRARRGAVLVPPGDYRNVKVKARGRWRVKLKPA